MFYVRKPKQEPIYLIRAVTSNEYSNYEKQKHNYIVKNTKTNTSAECANCSWLNVNSTN